MVQFLNAKDTLGKLENIIRDAANGIVIISPYLKVHDDIFDRLKDAASNRNIKITVICLLEDNLKPAERNERSRLQQIKNLTLIPAEQLHAKCFYNEQSMVIGSLNLYDSARGTNHEMGVFLRNDIEGDREAFLAAKKEAQFILRAAQDRQQEKIEPNPNKSTPSKTPKLQYSSKIEPENKFVRDIQTIGLQNKPKGITNVEKRDSIEPSQTGSIRCCPACGSNKFKVLWGKHGYYYKCDNCNGTASIKRSCLKCGKILKVRKAGRDFFFDCASCNTSALFYKNPT